MALAVVGLSHRSAPVEVRERFVFPAEQAAAALAELTAAGVAREAVLLSTCNRTELYLELPGSGSGSELPGSGAAAAPPGAGTFKGTGDGGTAQSPPPERDAEDAAGADAPVAGGPSLAAVIGLFVRRAGMPAEEAARYLYHRRGRAAAEHLFRVVTSLDSMILGEAQIQGQVRAAYETAAIAGPTLSRLFETALAVGGRVRSETALGAGAASVPSAAVELARKIFGSLRGRRALVLGAGEMSELALACLAKEGVRSVVVANRTEARARDLAERVGGRAIAQEGLEAALAEIDIIMAATAAPQPVLTRRLVDRVFPGGPRRPLLIVDIALPRDVEPAIGAMENVFLYDVDDLRQIVDDSVGRRRAEVPAAERIVTDAVDDFWRWYAARDVVPLIRELRERAEAVRQTEVEKALRRLPDLAPGEREVVEALTRQLLAKVLHRPTVRLREAAGNGNGVAVVHAARYLFELDGPDREGEPGAE